ncbi:MAG: thioredoxin domain-containing protein [Firmicutes bacterium]|nr:thioredoxin domain-containing protein [Bacillota bacterium]
MLESNRLIHQKSPYLLQHAYNPVDWHSWSEEAFEKAGHEDKPIFLSIGYSTCHWCHVMERESFEDKEVARKLNKDFISIKVDREERPDIDQVYMTVCQALTGHGGWPLTIIMTPDKHPFFAGTYFPKHSKWGQPGLMDILDQVANKWHQERDELIKVSQNIVQKISQHLNISAQGELSEETLHEAFNQLHQAFDSNYGGFGAAPKFPTPQNLLFLLRYWVQTDNEKALKMVEKTLQSMHRGGIYDHIGFGFARYSTDKKWLVPHFEKMLYDNALLAIVYLEAYQVTREEVYARVAREIFTYILRDMTSPEGAFYSAEDADSEGEEGKFYVWTTAEINEILGPQQGKIFCQLYDITPGGNFEGKNIPNLINGSLKQMAKEWNMAEDELRGIAEECRIKLYHQRDRRVHPHKDDKVLTAWNSLLITALAKGASVLSEKKYADAAIRAFDFIWSNMRSKEGRLLARYREGEAALNAYLDDYAFLVWALLELYEASLSPIYLKRAVEITQAMLELFHDQENGGFFFYGKDSEQLFARPKDAYDGAMPSGNSVAALNLLRLARMTGDSNLDDVAHRQLNAFAGDIKDNPRAYTYFLTALQFASSPSREIVIAGDPRDNAVEQMVNTVRSSFMPNTLLVLNPGGDEGKVIKELIPFVNTQRAIEGKATAYVCQEFACQSPVTDPNLLKERLHQ